MRKQIPHGDDDLICPLHKAAMADVCHKCPLWTLVRGANPNTGEEIDRWGCSLAWLPHLLIEVAQQGRQGAAATESFRNEVARQYYEAAKISKQYYGSAANRLHKSDHIPPSLAVPQQETSGQPAAFPSMVEEVDDRP